MNWKLQPDQLHPGRGYLYQTRDDGGNQAAVRVVFVGYRPNPGEVLVRLDGKTIIVSRRKLFSENGACG